MKYDTKGMRPMMKMLMIMMMMLMKREIFLELLKGVVTLELVLYCNYMN